MMNARNRKQGLLTALALRIREAVKSGADPFDLHQIVALTLATRDVGLEGPLLDSTVRLGAELAREPEETAQDKAIAWAKEASGKRLTSSASTSKAG